MKRFLLIIALSIFGIGLSAQVRVNYDVIKTTYDLQSNGLVSNRMYQLENGNVAVVATMATDTSESFADRGTGYNFFDRESWDEIPESAVENVRTGWPGDEGTITMDATNFCAWMPPHPEDGFNGFQASMQYTGSANGQAGDYLLKFGVCAYPSIAVDPMGNIAVAYSAPDVTRFYMEQYYYRSLYVSYKSAGASQWEFSKLYDDNDSLHMIGECTYVSAVSNPVNINEFWFSCLTDDTPGFHTGTSGASQTGITTGTIDVFKYEPSDNFGLYITATTNIPDAGYVDGVGQYYPDKNVTLTAYPYEGYKFVNWTENGEIVSTDESYTFIVDSHREFVANFIELPAPKNLVATPNTSAISLSWDKVGNATSYNVYQNG